MLSFFSAVDLCRVGEAHAKLKSLASDEVAGLWGFNGLKGFRV